MSLRVSVDKIIEALEEELEIFSINHDLKEDTYKELTFVINSFSKYLKKEIAKNPKQEMFDIVKSFDETLEILSDGIFGTSINSFTVSLYKELPTLKRLMGMDEESIIKLKKENIDLRRKLISLEDKIRQLEEDLADAKRKVKSSSSSSGSYGGCGGSSRSYGRC